MEKWPETKHFVLEEKESEEAVDEVFTSNLSSSSCESDTVTRKKRREFKKELTAMIVSVWA